MDALSALCPLDGRYRKYGAMLSPFFSEAALIEHRIIVMIEYVRLLSQYPQLPIKELSDDVNMRIAHIFFANFAHARKVKNIETKGYGKHARTNHDVKACELYLRDFFEEVDRSDLIEWIHFGRTSEDVNNTAYALMLCGALDKIIIPTLRALLEKLESFATAYAHLPMLARTHGQPATPTTMGKEFAVFANRLRKQLRQLEAYKISIKLNGASGNYCADHAAFPDMDWIGMSRGFCTILNERANGRLELNLVTTQIEPHDTYAELFDTMRRINTIMLDFCQDIWRYVSDDWLVQKAVESETGSSTMPHKVNPIDFENAEGNLGLANALFEFFCRKLPISRLQRDLSDSTIERNFGVALGYCLVAYESVARGLAKISPNEAQIAEDLNAHPEVLAEAYQTILRSISYPDPYKALREISRGKKITLEDLHAFVHGLDDSIVGPEVKEQMLALTPDTYIGRAPALARLVL